MFVACLINGVIESRSQDHPNIIEGHGTIGLEILDQTENLDAVLIPVGGGALITGIATVIKKLKPEILVYVSCKYTFIISHIVSQKINDCSNMELMFSICNGMNVYFVQRPKRT